MHDPQTKNVYSHVNRAGPWDMRFQQLGTLMHIVYVCVPLGGGAEWRGWVEDAGHPTLDYAKQLLEPSF